ncbi:hypothetical protein A6A26_22780 (plasmid) [Pantoea sp. OXWO6B1]|nr:hypothetical protein A6A26_22780 [Pantoea sp. OXWO6B1]
MLPYRLAANSAGIKRFAIYQQQQGSLRLFSFDFNHDAPHVVRATFPFDTQIKPALDITFALLFTEIAVFIRAL